MARIYRVCVHLAHDPRIDSYQFPAIVDDEWDSNWLNIRIHVETERGGWSATDPSLTAADVIRLADWLEAIDEAKGQESEVD